MKNNKNTKKSFDTAMQKKAENNITIFNCSIILYALILFVVHSMALSSATVEGALAIRRVLMLGGVIGAMAIAAYSAYKSNKSLFKYAFMSLFVSVSTAGILYCDKWGLRVTVIGLVAAFIFTCIYAALTDKKIYYSSKKARTIFKSAIAVVYGILFLVLVVSFVQERIELNNYLNSQSVYDNVIESTQATDVTENLN